jgi:curved DNA-binding protein CbpA
MDRLSDAYRVLQVDPFAETGVIAAAFRALARRYHPDGCAPDQVRMADINRAYALVRSPELRTAYDRDRLARMRPVGPGVAGKPAAPAVEPIVVARSVPPPQPAARSPLRDPDPGDEITLDFGRYAGWRLSDLARHDADYVRWLARHSAGLRFREHIARLLPNEPDLSRRANSVA